jgi:hypothetical protein
MIEWTRLAALLSRELIYSGNHAHDGRRDTDTTGEMRQYVQPFRRMIL